MMSRANWKAAAWSLSLVPLAMLWPARARGDGGTVRLSEHTGGYQVTVFTAPEPLRAGPVDFSVLVQDADTGEPLPDTRVEVLLHSPDQFGEELRLPATTGAATNKLFRAAHFDLSAAGRWQVEVRIDGKRGPASVRLEVEAAEPLPRWQEMWFWIGWPAVPVVLFAVHQVLVNRRRGAPVAPFPSGTESP